jgi:hypothetical protein
MASMFCTNWGLAKSRKAQAQKFFEILPNAEGEIIQMKKMGAA